MEINATQEMNLGTPLGTRDYTGLDMRIREYVISLLKNVYESFGYSPQHTPVIESAKLFEGHHGAGERLIFRFSDSNSRELALRYDLTVPLARVVNTVSSLALPYRRYQIAPSFRDDKVGNGSYREFTQCDADIVGSDSLLADTEILHLAYLCLKRAGLADFTLRINHRSILKGIADAVGLKTKGDLTSMLCALDESDKSGATDPEGVIERLTKHRIDSRAIVKIVEILNCLRNLSISESLKELQHSYPNSADISAGSSEIQEIISYLPEDVRKHLKFDVRLARGANYYTGVIFEGVAHNVEMTSAVLGGGRYDHLVAAVGSRNVPAVGMAIGLERFLTVLGEMRALDLGSAIPKRLLFARSAAVSLGRAVEIMNGLRECLDVCFHFEPVDEPLDSADSLLDYFSSNHFSSLFWLDSEHKGTLYRPMGEDTFCSEVSHVMTSLLPKLELEIRSC